MAQNLNYKLNLPVDLNSILEQEFWYMDDISPLVLQSESEPVKFSASTWIYVKEGTCEGELSLISHTIKAPSLVWVRSDQILKPKYLSHDFKASAFVMSKRITEKIFAFLSNTPLHSLALRHPVLPIEPEYRADFDNFFRKIGVITQDTTSPYSSQAIMYTILSFIFTVAYKCYEPFKEESLSSQSRLTDRFFALVQQHFRSERFLEFYANKLDITTKHLSRTIKQQTGYTAVEWIERFVILEAQVLLKSSNLNIQQISDELHFPSQSFFGKYFKKLTGMTPKEFRNS